MCDKNSDVSMDSTTLPGHFLTFSCACRTDKQVHGSTEIGIHEKGIIRAISRFVQSYTIQVEEGEKDKVQEVEEDEDKLQRKAKLLVWESKDEHSDNTVKIFYMV